MGPKLEHKTQHLKQTDLSSTFPIYDAVNSDFLPLSNLCICLIPTKLVGVGNKFGDKCCVHCTINLQPQASPYLLPKFRGLVPTVWRREGVERGAVGVSEDGGEDGAEEEGAGAPEGRVDAARVARVEVQQLDAAGGLERAVHVPQVLRVHQGQGGAVCRGGGRFSRGWVTTTRSVVR